MEQTDFFVERTDYFVERSDLERPDHGTKCPDDDDDSVDTFTKGVKTVIAVYNH